MDRPFRSRQFATPNSSNGFQARKAKATVTSSRCVSQETSTTPRRKATPLERSVDLIGSRLLFILILVASFSLVLFEEVPTAPSELQKPWRVDIQHAPKDELMLLEGIGTSLADRIIVYRETHVLNNVEDLLQVHGIGPKKIARCRRTIFFSEDSE
ncbi:MAG: helix-hairpin-helix domain-containing protein [Phycisphaerae bacterium]|jgi:competence ComEA-like helix-hairpin-helix protein|nr:helix-hairpin-helix domain-containing protein [Phycisphaerae bacterium]